MKGPVLQLTSAQARRIWLHAQRLDIDEPFGSGPRATPATVAHLGYVQIDTINVIERSHHHILYTRNPSYRREHLNQAQSVDRTIFEYWTHALSYLPTESMRFYVRHMRRDWHRRVVYAEKLSSQELRRVLARIRRDGPLTIRDFDNDALVVKDYSWGSRKPAKRALEAAFYKGLLTISQRVGMLKTYELLTRHFGWERLPRAAMETETLNYLLDSALRSQGVVSVKSIGYLSSAQQSSLGRLVGARVRGKELIPVHIQGAGQWLHWMLPDTLDACSDSTREQVHILSPFDPLVSRRERFKLFFDCDYRFEAYVPEHKRKFGYFVCPVLLGHRIVAGLDLKVDRQREKLLVRRWNWLGRGGARAHRQLVEGALHKFEQFQLCRG